MADHIKKTLTLKDTDNIFTLKLQQFKSEIEEAIKLTTKRHAQ